MIEFLLASVKQILWKSQKSVKSMKFRALEKRVPYDITKHSSNCYGSCLPSAPAGMKALRDLEQTKRLLYN